MYSALDGASVDILEKKIIWSDGERLTIEQSAEKIHRETGMRQDAIISHIMGWFKSPSVDGSFVPGHCHRGALI